MNRCRAEKACLRALDLESQSMRLMLILASLLLSGILAACASGTTYMDPANPQGAPGWGPFEIKQTSAAMASDLLDFLSQKKEPVLLAFKPIRNRTSEHIETELLASHIRSSLIQKKIYFVQLGLRGEILKEMEIGQSGLIDDSAIPLGNLKSPNYYLEGVITDTVNVNDGRSIQYLVVTLNLTEARSGVTQWSRNKEFLKSTKTDAIGW